MKREEELKQPYEGDIYPFNGGNKDVQKAFFG